MGLESVKIPNFIFSNAIPSTKLMPLIPEAMMREKRDCKYVQLLDTSMYIER